MTGHNAPDILPLATTALNGEHPEYAPCAGCNRIYRVATVTATGDPLCAACSYTGPAWDDPVTYSVDVVPMSRMTALHAVAARLTVWVSTQRGTAQGQLAKITPEGAGYVVTWPGLQCGRTFNTTTPEAALVLAEYLVGQKPGY